MNGTGRRLRAVAFAFLAGVGVMHGAPLPLYYRPKGGTKKK